jgi:hypothetical protein
MFIECPKYIVYCIEYIFPNILLVLFDYYFIFYLLILSPVMLILTFYRYQKFTKNY